MLQEKVQESLKMTAEICIKGKVMQNCQGAFPCEIFLMAMWPIICLEGYPTQPFPSLEWHSGQVLMIRF